MHVGMLFGVALDHFTPTWTNLSRLNVRERSGFALVAPDVVTPPPAARRKAIRFFVPGFIHATMVCFMALSLSLPPWCCLTSLLQDTERDRHRCWMRPANRQDRPGRPGRRPRQGLVMTYSTFCHRVVSCNAVGFFFEGREDVCVSALPLYRVLFCARGVCVSGGCDESRSTWPTSCDFLPVVFSRKRLLRYYAST